MSRSPPGVSAAVVESIFLLNGSTTTTLGSAQLVWPHVLAVLGASDRISRTPPSDLREEFPISELQRLIRDLIEIAKQGKAAGHTGITVSLPWIDRTESPSRRAITADIFIPNMPDGSNYLRPSS